MENQKAISRYKFHVEFPLQAPNEIYTKNKSAERNKEKMPLCAQVCNPTRNLYVFREIPPGVDRACWKGCLREIDP